MELPVLSHFPAICIHDPAAQSHSLARIHYREVVRLLAIALARHCQAFAFHFCGQVPAQKHHGFGLADCGVGGNLRTARSLTNDTNRGVIANGLRLFVALPQPPSCVCSGCNQREDDEEAKEPEFLAGLSSIEHITGERSTRRACRCASRQFGATVVAVPLVVHTAWECGSKLPHSES